MKKIGRFGALFFVLACGDIQVIPGSLHNISDAVLMTCRPYLSTEGDKTGKTDHTCLVVANPQKQALRVFDVTENQFVLSPLGFDILNIKVGPVTTMLANVAGQSLILALDPFVNNAFRADSLGTPQQLSFITPGPSDTAKLTGTPVLASALITKSDLSTGLITLEEDDTNLHQYQVQTDFTKPLVLTPDPVNPTLNLGSDKFRIMGASANWAAFGINSGTAATNITVANLQTWTIDTSKAFAAGGPVSSIVVTEKNGTVQILAARTDTPSLMLWQRNGNTWGDGQEFKLTGTGKASVLYLPGEGSAPCFNGWTSWAAAVTEDVKLAYVNLDNPKADSAVVDLRNSKVFLATENVAVPTKIVGGSVIYPQNPADYYGNTELTGCTRRMFYTFGTGIVATSCEGGNMIRRIDSAP